jgi:hypothetical protein
VILHRDERRRLVCGGIVLHLCDCEGNQYNYQGLIARRHTLVGVAGRHPDVPNVSSLDDVMQSSKKPRSTNCIFNGCFIMDVVSLEDVNVVQGKAEKRVLDRVKNVLRPMSEKKGE